MGEARTFRIIYPIEAWDGGKNSKFEPNIIADNESPDCQDVVFDDLGGVQTRDGSKKLNTAVVGSFVGDGMHTVRFNDGTEKMVAWWNGSGHYLSNTSWVTIPSAVSVFTAGTRVDMAMYQNLAFFGNGGSIPYKWNGTDFTRHGVYAPNSTAADTSGAAGAGGGATGDINYKITYVNSYSVESDVSPATTTLTVATTATVSLTAIPIAPQSFGVASRRVYRRDSTTGGSYKRVTEIADNTTATYVDNVAPTSLGVTAPTDNGVPPLWKYIVAHQERLWLAEDATAPQTLYYSELGTPFTVASTNTFLMEKGDGEIVRGLSVHANNVLFYKDASVWALYLPDTTPGNWIRLKTNAKYGGASHYAIADYEQLQMYIGKRYEGPSGFFAMAGVNTQPDAVSLSSVALFSDSQSERIEPDVLTFNATYLKNSCAINFKNKLWFSVPGAGSTVNNKIYQFDFKRRDKSESTGSFIPFSLPYGIASFSIYNNKLYAQSSSATGQVYQLDASQYQDDGTALNSYYWTKEFRGHKEHIENQKDFRHANFVVETLGAWYMNITYRTDSDSGVGTTQAISLTPGGSIWGILVWGLGLWGGGQSRKSVRVFLSPKSGKWIQFRFTNQNTAGNAFHVLPASTFSYNLRGLR